MSHLFYRARYEAIPLRDTQDGALSSEQEGQRSRTNGSGILALLSLICGATIALTVRIETLRQTLLAPECASRSREVWLPFIVAFYDAAVIWFCDYKSNKRKIREGLGTTVNCNFDWSSRALLFSGTLRYIPAGFLLSAGCHLVAGPWFEVKSTLVCPLSSPIAHVVPALQWISVFFDASLAILALELSHECRHPPRPALSLPLPWIIVTALSAGVWATIFVFVYALQPENHAWLVFGLEASRYTHMHYLFSQALFLGLLCVATLYSVRSLTLPVHHLLTET